jgi:hypothetical protein
MRSRTAHAETVCPAPTDFMQNALGRGVYAEYSEAEINGRNSGGEQRQITLLVAPGAQS